MQKASIVAFVGLVLASPLIAEPLVEGRVRLSSGEAVTAAQVRVFDLAALQRGPVAQVTTDADGHFALPLAALGGPMVPQGFALGQNYPNPFNPATIIPYQLPTAAHVRLEVFNVLGQRVATLVNGERPAGLHAARWDATDAAGQAVAAGVYIYRLRGAGVELTRRLVLVDGQAGTAAVGAAVNEIYVMDADGEDEYLRRLTNNSEADGDPAWSPNGTQIAFISFRSDNSFVMDASSGLIYPGGGWPKMGRF